MNSKGFLFVLISAALCLSGPNGFGSVGGGLGGPCGSGVRSSPISRLVQ